MIGFVFVYIYYMGLLFVVIGLNRDGGSFEYQESGTGAYMHINGVGGKPFGGKTMQIEGMEWNGCLVH